METRRFGLVMVLAALAALVSLTGCGSVQPQTQGSPAVRFEQIDLRIDAGTSSAVVVDDSGWGWLHVTHRGDSRLQYLNLTVGESWAVQNLPLISVLGPGVEQTTSIAFGLGVAPGTRVTELRHGLSLTDTPLELPPPATQTAPVYDGRVVFSNGQRGDDPPMNPAGPRAPLAGGAVAEDQPHTNDADFPNQESDPNACVPVAVSNSLQWLKKVHKIPDAELPPGDTDIAGWARRFGTTPDGTPLGPDGRPSWPKKKADYRKPGFPIETTEVPPADIAKIGDFMDRDCDVELSAETHVASVVGIVRTKDGKYTITVRHDTDQGNAGGTRDEQVVYDPATGKISGGTFLDGRGIYGFVVECYKKPS